MKTIYERETERMRKRDLGKPVRAYRIAGLTLLAISLGWLIARGR